MDLNSVPIKGKYSVVDETYSFLKKSISEGLFQPGSRLYIDKISKQLGVSRTPVREAINRLEVEGLIVSIPRKGPAVNVVSKDEIEEIQGIRAELESYGAKLAIGRITEKEIALLENIESRIEKFLKESESFSEDIPSWKIINKLNWQFHSVILKVSGNRKLYQIMNNFNTYLYQVNMMIEIGRPVCIRLEYIDILDFAA